MGLQLPRLYAIVDPQLLPENHDLFDYTRELISAGVTLLQFRDKRSSSRTTLSDAREMHHIACSSPQKVMLIMNDRADLARAAAFDGVHLGQEDLSPEAARLLCPEPMLVGLSTHERRQVSQADASKCDYVAIGPVFATNSKSNPDPIVGVDGVRAARKLTRKPLVAIGGISLENCREVIEAGADSVAVITALHNVPGKSVEAFLSVLG